MRIAYFVHGRGRGHASRAQTIVPALTEDGHDLRLFAGDQAIDLLAGLSVAAINSVKPGLRGTLLIPGRLGHDRAELKKSKPDLVISDGDAPSLVAARSLGIPTLAIGHDLVFTGCQLPSDLPTGALRAERRSALFASRLGTRGVAVHFLPIQPARSEIVCARPSLRQELSGTPPSSVGGIVSYFRDRNGRHCVSLAASSALRSRHSETQPWSSRALSAGGSSPMRSRASSYPVLRSWPPRAATSAQRQSCWASPC